MNARASAATTRLLDVDGHSLVGSEYVDRRKMRLACDAVPKIYRKADVAGPKRIPSAAHGYLSAAVLDDGRHGKLACPVEPDWIFRAAIELEECIAIAARAMAKIRALGQRSGGPGESTAFQQKRVEVWGGKGCVRECRHHTGRAVTVLA